MGLVMDWIRGHLGREENIHSDMIGGKWVGTTDLSVEIYYKELAIQSCISFIANALVMSEFQTFREGKEVKEENYYLFNVEPNRNQNAVEFWHEVISKLIYENECLVVQIDNQLFVAESFQADDQKVTMQKNYQNVSINGISFNKTFLEEDVFYFRLKDKHIKGLIDGLYSDYGRLIASAKQVYEKAGGIKGTLEIEGMIPIDGPQREAYEDLVNNQFKKYLNAVSAILPLSKGMKFNERQKNTTKQDSRDIRQLINDVIDFSCAAFHLPGGVVRGDVVGVAELTDNAITFGIKPFACLITAEVNRKYYGKQNYLNRTFLQMDVKRIKDVDIEKMAKTAEILFRCGVHSANENRDMIGKGYLPEEWANQYYITKNYSEIQENGNDLKGGGINGKTNDEPRNP